MIKFCPNCEEEHKVTLEKCFEHFSYKNDDYVFTCQLKYYKCCNCGEMFEDAKLLNKNLLTMHKFAKAFEIKIKKNELKN